MHRYIPLVFLALLACSLPAQAQSLGYNQGWIDGKYGRDLSSGFDRADWQRVLQRTRLNGGHVLRVWLFEGARKEGLVWGGSGRVRVDPTFLRNVRTVTRLASAAGVRIYWTALSGNWASNWARGTTESNRHYNLLANKYGTADAFREHVLGPVLDVIRATPRSVYALDLMNEVQGSVRSWFWSDGWTGARRFIRRTAAFVHRRAPGIPVTASSGHHTGTGDILSGRFDGLGLDFLDVHLYSDRPGVPRGAELAAHARARRMPIVLGEFGQKTSTVDVLLQAQVVYGVLRDARRLGFAGAFAWRLEDDQPNGHQFSFYDGDRPRLAAHVFRWFARR